MSKQRKTTQRNKMPGLRLSRGIWQIEKRCKYSESGWLRESTGTSSRSEAESYLIKRLAQLEEQFHRKKEAIFLFEEAGLQYLTELTQRLKVTSSATSTAIHLDQLFPCLLYTSPSPRDRG